MPWPSAWRLSRGVRPWRARRTERRPEGAESEGRGGGPFGPGPVGGFVGLRLWSAGALVAVAAVLLCAAAGAASSALHAADVRRGPLPAWAQRYAQVTVELEVTGDPRVTRPKVRGSQRNPRHFSRPTPSVTGGASLVRARPRLQHRTDAKGRQYAGQREERRRAVGRGDREATTRGGRETREEEGRGKERVVDLPGATNGPQEVPRTRRERSVGLPAWRGLLPSTRIRVVARAAPPMSPTDRLPPCCGSPRRAAASRPVRRRPSSGWPDSLRAGLRAATDGLRPDARALLPGLVVGDTSRVPPDLDDAFRATDLTHLLAVSGSNLTIVLALLIGPPHLASRAERRGTGAAPGAVTARHGSHRRRASPWPSSWCAVRTRACCGPRLAG